MIPKNEYYKIAILPGKQQVIIDFLAQNTKSDGGFLLLYKPMNKTKIINSFTKKLQGNRGQRYVNFSPEQMIQARVLLLADSSLHFVPFGMTIAFWFERGEGVGGGAAAPLPL
ncbi:MAG: hypothetical protein PHY99_00070 [Bacteroidales bacterium]|nr:hypothetical protein [Bacteroidales bacterium]